MLQPGPGYNLTTANGVSTLDVAAEWPLPAEPDQYQVSVFKTSEAWGVQCRKGFVRYVVYRSNDPWAITIEQAEIRKFYGYPTGSKTTGDAATAADSSLVDLGGYISINPASVEGGSDNWGVYIIGAPSDDGSGVFTPYLAIMAEGSDADTKSEPFMGGEPTIVYFNMMVTDILEVETPSGLTYISLYHPVAGGMAVYNYNCQKWKVADVNWDGDAFVVTQAHLGPLCLPSPAYYNGLYNYDPASPPSWLGSPNYGPELEDWNDAWTDYTKDSTDATVPL